MIERARNLNNWKWRNKEALCVTFTGVQLPLDFPRFREAPQISLGKEQLLAVAHLEDAVTPLDQSDVVHPIRKGSLEFSRQPGSPFLIASGGTVLDAEIQWFSHAALLRS